jgi:hypothetical protein
MSSGIWAACGGNAVFTPLDGMLFRSVLAERHVALATGRLVSTLDEHAVLEALLEKSKPPLPTGTGRLHYLLATPFRYPPLPQGSRFGQRHEASLFYGSLSVETVLFESAYYRLAFWQGMTAPPNEPLTAGHTLFSADYACAHGIKLHQPPFNAWQADLTDRRSYAVTQALGSAMRGAGVEAFEFASARDPNGGLNVALFTPFGLVHPSPGLCQDWFSETTAGGVVFYCRDDGSIHDFYLATFLVNGVLPVPAA